MAAARRAAAAAVAAAAAAASAVGGGGRRGVRADAAEVPPASVGTSRGGAHLDESECAARLAAASALLGADCARSIGAMRRGGCRLVGSVKLPANADGSSVVVGAAAAVGHANAAANGGDASVRALAHDDALSTQIAFSAGARQQGGLAMSVFFPRGDAAAGGVAGSGGVLEIVKDLADDPLTPAEAEAVRGVVAAVEELRGQVRLRQQEQGHRERRQRQRQPQQLLDADDGRSGLGSRGTAAPRADGGAGVADEAFQRLEAMGARVFLPKARPQNDTGRDGEGRQARGSGAGGGLSGDWGELAGYSSQKRAIEDTVLLAITRPDVYAQIARGTRKGATGAADEQSASLTAVPRAVLFEGPPGMRALSRARFGSFRWRAARRCIL